MKNPELYQKTLDILVQAYFNDVLEYADCHACAVGNLIAAAKGYKVVRVGKCGFLDFEWKGNKPQHNYWTEVHLNGELYKNPSKKGLDQIATTGYTHLETVQIEAAFLHGIQEAQYREEEGEENIDINFNGLMAVVDVLDKIHENTDEVVTTKSKQLFKKELV